KADDIKRRVDDMRLVMEALQPVRGTIMDRKDRVLALSVVSYTVVANNLQMQPADQHEVAAKLAPVIGADPMAILKKLADNPGSGWVPLQKDLTLEQKRKIDGLRLTGIYFEQQAYRQYPQGMTANQVIGYMNGGKGAYGLEGFYEKELAGTPGHVLAELTAQKTPIEGTVKQQVDPQPGQTLVLSLDAGLQQLVEARLDKAVKDSDAKRAAAIAMDIHTGEILTMAMRPGADPGNRDTWGNPIDWNRVNNWTLHTLPPGSIFKTVTTSAALEEHAITLDTTFIDNGRLQVGSNVITNWDLTIPSKPVSTIADLLQRSSNVGLVQVGQRIKQADFVKYLKGFGFMDPTGVDLTDESAGYGLTNFDQKKPIDWANMYIGQHLEVTPLQMVQAVAAIANGGYLVQPHLVREIRDPDGHVIKTIPTETKRQVISAQTAKDLQGLMVGVIEKAYPQAKPAGYTAGGKTGTAQKFENGVEKARMVADFVGFAPASNPQVVMMIVVDEPKPPGYGGVFAAPIFADLMPQVMQTIGIAPDTPAALGQEKAPPAAVQGVVPDVQWLPLNWAKERLTAAGFTAAVKGTGDLVGVQSVKAGSAASAGSAVELTAAPKPPASENVHVPDFRGLSLTEAARLAGEVGLTLKSSGTGFVADQQPAPGAAVPARSLFSVRLAPR
ncbi:MAG: soprulation specific penicillin-binding protein, partial [Firmicutes bacterium]|nr:soprulation specific penicillin-binding protein [Bacillota bacterium]